MSVEKSLEQKLTEEIAEGASWGFLGKVLSRILTLPIKILLARFLGPAGLGIFELGRRVANWLLFITKLGLDHASMHFSPVYRTEKEHGKLFGLIIVVLAIPVAFSVLVGVSLHFNRWVILNVFGSDIKGYIDLFLVLVPFLLLTRITSFTLRGFKKIDSVTRITLARLGLNLVLLLLLFQAGFRILGAIFALLASHIFAIMISIYVIERDLKIQRTKPEFEFGKWFNFSKPIYFSNLFHKTSVSLDILFIGYFLSSSSVGVYSIAAALATLVVFPLMAINQILPPIISDMSSQGERETIEMLYQKSTRWIYLGAFPLFLILFLFPAEIINLLFGESYLSAVTPLRLLLVGQVFNMGFGSVGFLLQSTEYQEWNLYTSIVSTITNIGLNIALIPMFGIKGAAIATAISLFMNNFLQLLAIRLKLNMNPWNEDYLRLLLPLVISLIIYYISGIFSQNWVTRFLIFGTTLSGLIYLMALTEEDKQDMKTLMQNITEGALGRV
ncbi:MAG: polysaccharide biosynthesis C-terminal domain-containing protein [Candidatus Nanohaloarchaea archaeon]